MSKLKTIVFIIGILIILGFASKLLDNQLEYTNIENYIEGEFSTENVEVINVENFYYVVGYSNGNLKKEEIVYINDEGILEPAVIKGILNSTTYRKVFYPLVCFEGLVTFSTLEINSKYWILVETIVNSYENIKIPKYNFYDSKGNWEYIEVIDSDGTHVYRNYFTVIDELDDYCAHVYFEGQVYQIITGEELEYICNEDTKQRDIDNYYGLGN